MDAVNEDDDITLLRQSRTFLKELSEAFEHIEAVKSERELEGIIRKIEPYQEDPQLLDTKLGNFIPLLSEKFLANLHNPLILQHIGRILYTFCKVRTEKVVVGLLNNETKWIEPLLAVFDDEEQLPWEQSYILLLWLSHLMLSPFNLATISSFAAKDIDSDIRLPDDIPGIASQVVQIGSERLHAATIERKAASSLLVRLCIRQDMLQLEILGILAQWAIYTFEKAAAEAQIHTCLGILTFLSGLVASGDQKMLGTYLISIFRLSQRVLEDEALGSIRRSTIARKLVIKIQRNTVVHCLRSEQHELDTTEVVEQVIGALIELLADLDTPVRMAASKALSLVALKLDSDMASEVVEAVNASFHEELIDDDARTFWSVNAAKWHGIVLTLGHLIYRRAVSTEQIPDVLKSILLALSFEQRSTTGKSVGSNVRDAANYGLWAVARRFTTEELESVHAKAFAIHKDSHISSSIQYIALNLLVSACFDPEGNVRRGSSAALQELIGRHPNIIVEGITLVQVVDYQAVGLRARAATKVAHAAARLDKIYEKALIGEVFTWRGLSAASQTNRVDSAVFLGILVAQFTATEYETRDAFRDLATVAPSIENLFSTIRERLKHLKARDHEERQGLLLAASWILSALNFRLTATTSSLTSDTSVLSRYNDFILYNNALSMPEFTYVLSDDFKPRASRSDLVMSATLRLFGQLAALLRLLKSLDPKFTCPWDKEKHFTLVSKCLSRKDDVVLEQVPTAIRLSIPMLTPPDAEELVQQWLSDLAPENKRPGLSADTRILALGAAFNELSPSTSNPSKDIHYTTLQFLLQRYVHVQTEARIVILESAKLILSQFPKLAQVSAERQYHYLAMLATVLLLATHDYTISERGDVGSLVRVAGLAALQEAWSNGLLLDSNKHQQILDTPTTHLDNLHLDAYDADVSRVDHLKASVLRLSLEKLDKVRLTAVECWKSQSVIESVNTKQSHGVVLDDGITYLLNNGGPLPPNALPNHDVFSVAYFHHFLTVLTQTAHEQHDPAPNTIPHHIKLRILEGLCSTAGGASSGASQNLLNARQALHAFLSEPNSSAMVFASLMKDVIEINIQLENDQRLVSILDVLAFTLDMGALQHIATVKAGGKWSWKSLLASVQRAHFKSRNIMKLQISLDVYRGLAGVAEIREDVVKKVLGMLVHPIPAVRFTVAETLVCICGVDDVERILVKEDWTIPAKELKAKVEKIRGALDGG